jgi:hypothetical protein
MADIPLEKYAADKPELKAALAQWGTFERPKTPWGYAGAGYLPKVISR